MKNLRVLLVSRSRPSRTWKLAERIRQEVAGAAICGIVQQPMAQLSFAQQRIAQGRTSCYGLPAVGRGQGWDHLLLLLEILTRWVLWFIHGCPRGVNRLKIFTIADLLGACRQAGCPFLIADGMADSRVADMVRRCDLVIALDQIPPDVESWALPQRGTFQVLHAASGCADHGKNLSVGIDHHSRESKTTRSIASFAVPFQRYDGLLGLTLKADLILDDMLIEATKSLVEGSVTQAVTAVTEWIKAMLSPYLDQLEPVRRGPHGLFSSRPHRKTWKLCLDTLLLCSPIFIARNLYHRCRKRYPVRILTHHLVADRPHRMAISTEWFWRQVRFLQLHYQIVNVAQGVALLHSGTVSCPTVALTFDDGYQDNFINLRAVAQETGIPVALFLAVQPIEMHREFQHDLDQGITGFLPLTWNQIRYWRERGGEFGSHTMTHADCGSLDSAHLQEEIIGSRHALEKRAGGSFTFFAFPFGYPQNISLAAMSMAAATYSHFLSGFGGENFPIREGTTQHLFRKKHYSSLWELELELQSVFDLVDYGRRMFRCLRCWIDRSGAAGFSFRTSSKSLSLPRTDD